MTFPFSGPNFTGLFTTGIYSSFIGGSVGLVMNEYAKYKKSPMSESELSNLCGGIGRGLLYRGVADYFLYQLVCHYARASHPRLQAKIYALTNLSVNIVTLIAFRRSHLIGSIATAIFAAIIVIEMVSKNHDFSKYRSVSQRP